MANNNKEVLELIKEERSGITVEEFLAKLPKGKQPARDIIIKLTQHLKNEALEVNELELQKKQANDRIKNTEPMKALKSLKKKIKTKKSQNEKLLLMLVGARKVAEAMGVDLRNIKEITNGSM